MNKMISVIIPAYNEEGMITKTAETISAILASAAIDHELLLAEFWEGSSHVCRDVLRERSLLCGD